MALPPVVSTQAAPVDQAASAIVIQLDDAGTDRIAVKSVEIVHRSSRTRMTFHEHNDLSDVVAEDLCLAVLDLMGKQHEDGVYTNPDYRLNLPGLMLCKARVLVKHSAEGVRGIMIRFAMCMGNVTAIFSPTVRPWQVGHDQTQQLAAETLENVFLPLMNFADYVQSDIENIRETTGASLADGLERARQRINDLEVYYNVLVDFVASNQTQPVRLTHEAIGRLTSQDES